MQNNLRETLRELGKSYFIQAEKNPTNTLIMLVHGFGASCTETLPIAEFLKLKGYDSCGVLLAGHGTSSRDLDNIKWKEWISNIQDSYKKYAKDYTQVVLGGVSLGGALSLYCSSFMRFDGIFTINAWYDSPLSQNALIVFGSIFKIHVPRTEERKQWYLDNDLFSYAFDSTYAVNQVRKFHKVLHKNIKNISIPALIIQSQTDKTINPKNGEIIYEKLQTKKKIIRIAEGDYILTVDSNRQQAFDEIAVFIEEINQT